MDGKPSPYDDWNVRSQANVLMCIDFFYEIQTKFINCKFVLQFFYARFVQPWSDACVCMTYSVCSTLNKPLKEHILFH